MKNEFIISTTNNIEGCPIKKYLDTICSNIVIGLIYFLILQHHLQISLEVVPSHIKGNLK